MDNPLPLLQALDDYLLAFTYYGEWSSSASLSDFQFKNNQGFLQLSFAEEPSLNTSSIFQQVIYFYFYDGPYIDQNFIRFSLTNNRSIPVIDLNNGYLLDTHFNL